MNDSPQRDSSSVDSDALRGDGVSRRKLVRAGLASAPILMGLKSESALATGSVVCKPSMWASIKAANCKLSRQVIAPKGTCRDYVYWSKQNDDDCNRKFHNTSYKKNGVTYAGANFSTTFFKTDKALKDVCKNDWSVYGGARDELSRHCAAIFLSIKKGDSCPITEATCKAMWTGCKGGGTWSVPGTNVKWTAADCNEYLSYVCGKSLPTSC